MTKLGVLVALTTHENDYQMEQARSAEAAAQSCGVTAKILYAENDAVQQSTQILRVLQGPQELRPNAVIFEPVGGTALPQVARVAAAANIGWAVLNREAPYLGELRRATSAPVFSLSSNHLEIGRIQARQAAALLPAGGSVLYIQGPTENSAAKDRLQGMQESKPANVQLTVLKAQWTEESARTAVQSWMKLTTSRRSVMDLVVAQNDAMAVGARKAFQELSAELRDAWYGVPFTGCDGLPNTGQAWVRAGQLAATIFVPPNAGQAIEMIADAFRNSKNVPERVLTVPVAIPAISSLRPKSSSSGQTAHPLLARNPV